MAAMRKTITAVAVVLTVLAAAFVIVRAGGPCSPPEPEPESVRG